MHVILQKITWVISTFTTVCIKVHAYVDRSRSCWPVTIPYLNPAKVSVKTRNSDATSPKLGLRGGDESLQYLSVFQTQIPSFSLHLHVTFLRFLTDSLTPAAPTHPRLVRLYLQTKARPFSTPVALRNHPNFSLEIPYSMDEVTMPIPIIRHKSVRSRDAAHPRDRFCSIIEDVRIVVIFTVDYSCWSPVIERGMLPYLSGVTESYLLKFKDTFGAEKFIPKHHFLMHTPSVIRKFGPLRNFWCMPFETKHQYFKKLIKNK